MFKLRLIKKNKPLKLKCSFSFPKIVLANLQEKEAIPKKYVQEVVADKNYDGLSKVTVDKIPDEYIVPTGDVTINQNGTYDVSEKVNAIVNVPEKQLGIKTITSNGTYKATDDNLDGYSEVEVETNGVDINEYFNNNPLSQYSSSYEYGVGIWFHSISKLPPINVNKLPSFNKLFYNFKGNKIDTGKYDTSNITKMANTFRSCSNLTELDLSNFDTSNVTTMQFMFYGCSSLTSLDLSNFDTSNVTDMYEMFANCSSLTNLNISNFDFTNVTNSTDMFLGVPTNCYILVKDTTAREWITSKFTNLTNVHYVGEE